MITGELKSKVDKIWDTMWSGGISNPISVVEQLTYLLFIKRLLFLRSHFPLLKSIKPEPKRELVVQHGEVLKKEILKFKNAL